MKSVRRAAQLGACAQEPGGGRSCSRQRSARAWRAFPCSPTGQPQCAVRSGYVCCAAHVPESASALAMASFTAMCIRARLAAQ